MPEYQQIKDCVLAVAAGGFNEGYARAAWDINNKYGAKEIAQVFYNIGLELAKSLEPEYQKEIVKINGELEDDLRQRSGY